MRAREKWSEGQRVLRPEIWERRSSRTPSVVASSAFGGWYDDGGAGLVFVAAGEVVVGRGRKASWVDGFIVCVWYEFA